MGGIEAVNFIEAASSVLPSSSDENIQDKAMSLLMGVVIQDYMEQLALYSDVLQVDSTQNMLVERLFAVVASDDDIAVGALVNASVDNTTLVLETTSAGDDQFKKALFERVLAGLRRDHSTGRPVLFAARAWDAVRLRVSPLLRLNRSLIALTFRAPSA